MHIHVRELVDYLKKRNYGFDIKLDDCNFYCRK